MKKKHGKTNSRLHEHKGKVQDVFQTVMDLGNKPALSKKEQKQLHKAREQIESRQHG